ncbi:MAG: MBL fold metallo-hydrolase [Gemmatimonas sp.]|nr:MBL fold metallo-hydrolase [Gemmatimonas sp.]
MSLVLEQIHTPGIAQLSYLVGDDAAKIGAVIDPRRDVDIYVERALSRGLRIAYAIETHIHADFVSGVHELAARTGARILAGESPDYTFDFRPLRDGDRIDIGTFDLRAIHTPGHTPEHVSLALGDGSSKGESFAVFTGDTLLNKTVGRPDLIGPEVEEGLARELYHSIFSRLLPLGDFVELLPGHTAGSACGHSIGDRRTSTLGSERRSNPSLRFAKEPDFVRDLLGGLPEPPGYYARLKKLNTKGAHVRGSPTDPEPLTAGEFRERTGQSDALILDIRSMLAFGGGHLPGALHIGLAEHFPMWVGWMVDPGVRLFLVADSVPDVRTAVEHLFRLGYDADVAFLHPGMKEWQDSGLPLQSIDEWTVHELDRRRGDPDVIVLDVRSDGEWKEGRVPGARHVFLPHLGEHLNELDRDKEVVTYCGTGYRASIAASVLQRNGFERVATVPGSMAAWKAAGLPIAR